MFLFLNLYCFCVMRKFLFYWCRIFYCYFSLILWINNWCLYYVTVLRVGLLISLWSCLCFYVVSLEMIFCSSSWFLSLSHISFVELMFTYSLGLCLTHDWKNSCLKLLTSAKNELFTFLSSSKIFSLRFPISSIKIDFSWFSSSSLNFWFSFGSDKHSQFPTIFSLTDWFWINSSKSLPKVSLVTLSAESLNNLKTSSFLHFLFPRFSVWMEVIIDISSSLSLTVGLLKKVPLPVFPL